MRLVSFFVLSVSLHATALVYPVSFGGQSQPEIIRVAILPIEQESIGVGGHGGTEKAAPQGGLKSALRTRPKLQPGVEARQRRDPEPQSLAGQAAANTTETSVALVSALADSAESHGSALTGIANNGAYDSGAEGNATGTGESDGGMGIGTRGGGTGNGYGSGQNPGSPVMQITQVSFRHAPPPDYPDAARKDGKEGRVLLRVLVDEEGKSKLVEISVSSGSRLLDQAAAEAIKRWRFSPARYGNAPTASWVKIPVDFRLKESK
jgi:TonB family protein